MVAKSQAVEAVEETPPAVQSAGAHSAKETGNNLDRLIHERTRLALVSALAANTLLSFNDLKSLLQVSDGNLSAHARKLEDAGYIACSKGYDGRVPRTEYRLTESGRAALQKYIAHMEALILAMKNI
ncbi:MAG: transcriptional regulator [Gammaproteobacteria bacterium]|nr:transcriptional regulator [Gammaproteobacteria bacterium]